MTGARGHRRPGAAATAAVLCAVTAAGLYGCSGSGPSEPRPTPTPTPAPTTPPAGTSPLTGLPARSGPVLAVKIDNVPPARPHTGLTAADLVYVEQVESGQTRLMAVYSARTPELVGPVRSARESDLALLRQFGRPVLAYSGAQSALTPLLKAAPLHLVSEGTTPGAFLRDPARSAPHNLYLRPARALAAAPDATHAKDIGFRFGAAPQGGEPVNSRTVSFPAVRYTFTWAPAAKAWHVAMDGRADGPLAPATVVVQHITVRSSRFHDFLGAVSPYSVTTGSGTAEVLRDGRAYPARWSRPDADRGTAFTTPAGAPLNFAPGQVWVLLTGTR
ncbi:DUF3048 domain-containing protein [Streptomyces sp. SKN60]|uniref:DUF3048 domain-containing protein n=1 Tax=Streptomyces sp. SKN60 TaxID=2855506 RepID=UPI002246BE8B|nr:DUF3048 domain-containing protein [Streptomyces sp. SKN60]MCX2183668.1 DUF3048 domain-containing protein [Streptomyces sp. SKN60]